MGSKLTVEIFTLNNASSLWWVRRGEKIGGSISSLMAVEKKTTNSANQFIKIRIKCHEEPHYLQPLRLKIVKKYQNKWKPTTDKRQCNICNN